MYEVPYLDVDEWIGDLVMTGFGEEFGDTDPAYPRVAVRATHASSEPGTYFRARRATSQRQGDSTTTYTRFQNLGRVRVVVR